MTHCRNEKSDENARWLSSQVFDESAAQTVMIKLTAFMPKSSGARQHIPITQPTTKPAVAGFHQSVKRAEPKASLKIES